MNLLMRAKEASSTAPASLTGLKISDRETCDAAWHEDSSSSSSSRTSMLVVRGQCEICGGSASHDGTHDAAIEQSGSNQKPTKAGDNKSLDIVGASETNHGAGLSTSTDRPRKQGRNRSITVSATLTPSPSKPLVSSQPLSSSDASISVPALIHVGRPSQDDSVTPSDWPTHACGSTVALLVSQLTELHDKQQATQKIGWDTFLKKRKRNTRGKLLSSGTVALFGAPSFEAGDDELLRSEGLVGVARMGHSANKEEWREFSRLVRAGIPLIYRAKIWSECSGALDIAEPGAFQKLLSVNKDQIHPTLVEIDKDVRRTSKWMLLV